MVEQAIALREHMSTRRDVARGMASGPRLPAARKRRIVVERIATGGEDRAGCVVRMLMDQSARTDGRQKAQEERRRDETTDEQQRMRACQNPVMTKRRDRRPQCARARRHLGHMARQGRLPRCWTLETTKRWDRRLQYARVQKRPG